MPKTIKIGKFQYVDPSTGQYVGVNAMNDAELAAQVQAVEDSIAPDYADLAFPVAAGQKCYYEDVLYAANQDIPVSEAWTPSHWGAVTVGGELSSLSNALSKSSENTNIAISAHPVGDLFWYNGTLHVATSAIAVGDTIVDTGTGANCKDTTISEALIKDVQVNGVSVLTDGVAIIPIASAALDNFGLVKASSSNGINVSNGVLSTNPATETQVKVGTSTNRPLAPATQDKAAFYGLAKAAGDSTQSASSKAVGTYTEDAKSSISQMLNGAVQVTGTTPVIAAKAGIRYICGECATLDITAPASGIIDVVFESGSTPTVLTVTPPTGITAVKWANGFDPSSLEANTKYEISIMDGELGAALSWT